MILVFFIFPNLVLIRINAISIAFLYVITYNYHNCWEESAPAVYVTVNMNLKFFRQAEKEVIRYEKVSSNAC